MKIDYIVVFEDVKDHIDLGYVWFPENLRENARERKYKGKLEGKKK